MKNVKALVLFSGGLDSILAAKVLLDQGLIVGAISFKSNFYDTQKAKAGALNVGIQLIEKDISWDMFDLVKNPPSGHGKNMNPCIDCHAMMMRSAAEFLRSGEKPEGYDFLATGEVLGQRPFSQNKSALLRVAKLAGVEVLRPLSARLLPETEMERAGLIDRQRLHDISGRGRHRQMELAKFFKINMYPSPGGGCLLTDPAYAKRLKSLFNYRADAAPDDADLMKCGRLIWFSIKNELGNEEKTALLIGRNKEENDALEKLVKSGDIVLKLIEMAGPTGLLRMDAGNKGIKWQKKEVPVSIPASNCEPDQELLSVNGIEDLILSAASLTGYYSVKARGRNMNILLQKI